MNGVNRWQTYTQLSQQRVFCGVSGPENEATQNTSTDGPNWLLKIIHATWQWDVFDSPFPHAAIGGLLRVEPKANRPEPNSKQAHKPTQYDDPTQQGGELELRG